MELLGDALLLSLLVNSAAQHLPECVRKTLSRNYYDIMNTLAVGLQVKWILKE